MTVPNYLAYSATSRALIQYYQNVLKGGKMAEANFTDILIVGNHAFKPPRKDGKNKEGKDQFIITFSLSKIAKGAWIETFNRVWEHSKEANSLQLPKVKDDQIQIICTFDDQLQCHLDNLKVIVARANREYREELQASDDEKRSLEVILQTLRF